MFDNLLESAWKNYAPNDLTRVLISHSPSKQFVIVPPEYLGDIDTDLILETIESNMYSAGAIPADDNIEINMAFCRLSMMNGQQRLPMTNPSIDVFRKTSIIAVNNKCTKCLPLAILISKAKFDRINGSEDPSDEFWVDYDKARKTRVNCIAAHSEDKVVKLMKAAKVEPDSAGTIQDIYKYENYLEMSIAVCSTEANFGLVYRGNPLYRNTIYLFHSKREESKDDVGHYDVITSMTGYLCKSYYCQHCKVGFNKGTHHSCKYWCNVCGRNDCVEGITVKCDECNQQCRSVDCHLQHKQNKAVNGKEFTSFCTQHWCCPTCSIVLVKLERAPELHECGEIKCPICQQYYLEYHRCYLRSQIKTFQPEKFLFYDFESTQENGIHIPNLVVAHSVCESCEKEPVTDQNTCSECGERCIKCHKTKDGKYIKPPCLNKCGKRRKVFKGKDTSEMFYKWLIQDCHKDFTCIAHNARAYDAYFLLEKAIKHGLEPSCCIFQGSKIMYMKIDNQMNMRIIDSLNFLPMGLAALPKSFGLSEMKKGFFPHLFNKTENQKCKLSGLPDIEYYDPDSMYEGKRDEFNEWYEANKNVPFDFEKEILEYCISDVDILLNACMKYRLLTRKATCSEEIQESLEKVTYSEGIDPFSFITIASVCMGTFKAKFLPEKYKVLLKENEIENCLHEWNCDCVWNDGRKTNAFQNVEVKVGHEWKSLVSDMYAKCKFISSPIPLVPNNSLSGPDVHSKESIQWMNLMQKSYRPDIPIRHARTTEGEQEILIEGINGRKMKVKVDGYREIAEKKIVYEYHGCNWHGCIKCYPRERDTTMNGRKSMSQRYIDTMRKESRLLKLGYKLITIWSCDFKEILKDDPSTAEFVAELDIQDPLNLKDSYVGGRTNALTLFKKVKDQTEKISYVDFTSLYPDVMKNNRFPVGKPVKISTNFDHEAYAGTPYTCQSSICKYCQVKGKKDGIHVRYPFFGSVKCKILPPQDLKHPVLFLKHNKKLKFPLCYTCAINESQKKCDHKDKQRSFIGTFCTPEIETALNVGYKIVKLYEILHFQESEEYDPKSKTGGLFTEYINTFLKLKQEASGYPEDVVTPEQKTEYIDNYLFHEGIQLDPAKIEKNAGLRSIAKLALNSFYGKFGQKSVKTQTRYLTKLSEIFQLMTCKSITVVNFRVVSETCVLVEYKQKDGFEPEVILGNVNIAAFVTCHARLKLWTEMYLLQDRVLYHDTDSIIFVSNTDSTSEYKPFIGKYLGQMTNELECKEIGCKLRSCEGHWIDEFVSCGPKNYAFKLNTGEVTCKIRGFSLNYRASLLLNLESMKKSLFAFVKNNPQHLSTYKTEIRRNKYTMQVYNSNVKKRYKVVYNKRRIIDNFETVPFGFKA